MANDTYKKISRYQDSSNKMIHDLEIITKYDFAGYSQRVESLKAMLDIELTESDVEGLVENLQIQEVIFNEGKEMIIEFLNQRHYDLVVKPEIYTFLASRIFKVKQSDSWRGKKSCEIGYKKEEKEAFNAMIFVLLLIYREQVENKEFDKMAVISYIIRRLIKKSYTWDSKPENKAMFLESVKGYDKFEMAYARAETIEEVGFAFTAMIHGYAEKITPEEELLFQLAKAIADYVEFKQIQHYIFKEERQKTKREIRIRLRQKLKASGLQKCVTKDFISLLERISWGRNTIRWQGDGYTVDCSILSHMLETAIFGWLMGLERNQLSLAEDAFFVGLFHDLPEIWTDDIPSPCKDSIRLVGGRVLRPLTEEFERVSLVKYFYPKLNPQVAEYCRRCIMFEQIHDKDLHDLIKKADYFSADYELWWNIVCGSRNVKFYDILKSSVAKNRTPATTKVLEDMVEQLEGVQFLKP